MFACCKPIPAEVCAVNELTNMKCFENCIPERDRQNASGIYHRYIDLIGAVIPLTCCS